MSIKVLKSRKAAPVGGVLYGFIAVDGANVVFIDQNLVLRFFTPNTTTEIGRAIVRGTKVDCHLTDDTTNTVTSATATDLATAITLANELKADYNAHIASTTFHTAADTTNAVTSANATDQATLNTLLNEMKADFNAHRVLLSVHAYPDTAHAVTKADASTLATSIALVNEFATSTTKGSADYTSHLRADGFKFTCYNILPGTYDIGIKTEMSCSVLCEDIVVAKGAIALRAMIGHLSSATDFGGLWLGEIGGNDAITLADSGAVTASVTTVGGCQAAGYGGAAQWGVAELITDFGTFTIVRDAQRRSY